MARGAIGLLLLVGGAGGCDAVCGGRPWCEAQHPTARLAVHNGGRWGDERAVWLDADGLVTGTLDEGAEWSVVAGSDGLYVGLPEANAVVRLAVPAGEESFVALEAWTGRNVELGRAVALERLPIGRAPALWAGAPGFDNDRGAVYVLDSAVPGDVRRAPLTLTGATTGDRFGENVVACADLTGDGRPDWLVGAPGFSAPAGWPDVPDLAGAAFLVASDGLDGVTGTVEAGDVATVWWGDGVGSGAGAALSCTSDVDGDGVADVLVGAPWDGDDDRGALYVLRGGDLPASGALGAVAWRTERGDLPHDWLGAALLGADLDGDGNAELVASAPGYLAGRGRVLVYAGPLTADGALAAKTSLIGPAGLPGNPHLGRTLATGDLDGDSLADLLVGSPDWTLERAWDVGRLSVWYGAPGGWGATLEAGTDEDRVIVGAVAFQRVGGMVGVRDLDDDGEDDVVLVTRSREL